MLIPPQHNAGEAHGFSMGPVPVQGMGQGMGQAHMFVQGFRIGDQPGSVAGSVPGMPPANSGANVLFVPSQGHGGNPQSHGQPTAMLMRMIGPPGMDSRTHLSDGDQNPDKLFESPVFKKMVSLIEENAQLKAQLKVQAIESETRARIQELESALRSRDGRVGQTDKPLEEKHDHLRMQQAELENMRQKLESQRRDLERQREELHRQAHEVKNVQVIELKRDLEGTKSDQKNHQIEVRVLDKADMPKDVAVVQNQKKAAVDEMSLRLAKTEAALKEALRAKEVMSTQLNELEHRSRLLEKMLSSLGVVVEEEEQRIGDSKANEEAREKAEQEKKKTEAAAREAKERAIAKEREEREERRKAEAKRKEESRKKEETREKEESKDDSSQQDRKEE